MSDSKYDDMSVMSLDGDDGLLTPLPGSSAGGKFDDSGPRVFGVKVVLRPRPSQEEGRRIPASQFSLTFVDDSQVQLVHADKTHRFTYDHVFAPGASQDDVYELAARSTINDVLKGYNGTIFAYGQTGSGKTHTMFGPGAVGMAADGASGADLRGIIPRAVREIYERTAEMAHECQFTIRVSFLEVYQERIYDLLIPASPALPIRENKDRGIHVPGLTEEFCPTEKDVGALIARGERLRSVATTMMNDRSSRSHSVLVLTLEQRNLRDGSSCVGRLNLVDLAGSERIYRSGVTGAQFEEATVINLSLTTLGRVVNALTTTTRGTNHIPYRDSTLTRFLQDSLGGNTKTTLVVTIAIDASSGDETLSSLRFGQRAKFIKNRATVNVKKTSEELEKMIVNLRAQLAAAHATIATQAARIKELESRQNGVAPSLSAVMTTGPLGVGGVTVGGMGMGSSVSPTSMLVDDESPSHSPELSPVSPMRTGAMNKVTREKGRSPYSSDPRPMEGGYCRYQFVADPMHKITLGRSSVAATQAIDSLLCYDRWSTEHFLQSYSLAGPLALLPLLSPSPMVTPITAGGPDGEQQNMSLTADNWNERFQTALELGEETEAQSMHKYALLEQLSVDFLSAARTYGKLIISEQFLAEDQRTIRALANGGVAGGQRFLVRGIIFKLAQDPLMMAFGTPPFFLYGGRKGSSLEYAAKAAAHDLKAASNYFELTLRRASQKKLGRGEGLRIPLQATIDYRGFRLTAMPWLPLKGTAGLVYGSADGGATVHDDDPTTTSYMEYASNELHIAPHYVGDALLYAAGDMEAHRGTDGRVYVLDLARAFPPECPYASPVPSSSSLNGEHGSLPEQPSIFYRFLRREYLQLLKQCGYPGLSPDCYSGWSEGARDAGIQHHRLTLATEALTKTVIPAIATYLDGPDPLGREEKARAQPLSGGDDQLLFALSLLPSMLHLPTTASADDIMTSSSTAAVTPSLPTAMIPSSPNGTPTPLPISSLLQFPASPQIHAWGMNMRHMGLLRSLIRRNQRARDILLIEMVARTLKNTLRGWLRGMGSANSRDSSSMPSSLSGAVGSGSNTSGRDASDGPVRKTIVLFFNLVTASLDKRYCDHFWQHTVLPGLYQRFGPMALDGDDLTKTDLLTLSSSHLRVIIEHTLTMMGMQLTSSCSTEFAAYRSPASLADEDWRGFLFTPMDIEDQAVPKTKHLGLLEYAQGRLLCGLARSARLARPAGLRLLPMAAQRFRTLLHPSARIEWTLARAMHAEWQTNAQLADYTLINLLDELFTPPNNNSNGGADDGYNHNAIVRASSPPLDSGIYFPESCLPVLSTLLDMWEGRLRDCASALANNIFTRIKTHAHFGGASSYYALRRLRECNEVWVKTDPESTILRGDEKDNGSSISDDRSLSSLSSTSSSSSAAHVRTSSTSSMNGSARALPQSQASLKRVQALEKLRDSVLTRTARLLLQCFGSSSSSELTPPIPVPGSKSQPLTLMQPLVAPSTSIAAFLSLMNSATPPPPAPPSTRPAASPWEVAISASTRETKTLAQGEATALNEEWRRILRKLAIRLPATIQDEMKNRSTPSAVANGVPPFFLPRYLLFKLLPLLDTEVACLLAQELGIDMDWRLEDNSTGNGGAMGGIDGLEARERSVGRAGSYIVIAGKTPLMCAAEAGWPASVAALLAAGADPTAMDSAKRTPLAWADIGRASEEASGEDEAEIDGAPKPSTTPGGRPGSSSGNRPGTTTAAASAAATALRREEAAKRKRARAADRDQVLTLLMEARKQQSSARQAAELADLLRMVNERKQLLRLIQDKKQAIERAVEDSRPNDRVVVKQQRDEWLRRERDELEGRAELQKMLLQASDSDGREAYEEAHGAGIERDVKKLKLGVDIAASLESQLRVTTQLLEETRQRLDEAKRERVVLDEREQGLRALLNKKKLPTEPPSPGGSSSGSLVSLADRGAVGRRASAGQVDLVPAHGLRRSQTGTLSGGSSNGVRPKPQGPITTYRLPPPAKSPPAPSSASNPVSISGALTSPGGAATIATPVRNGVPQTPPLTPSQFPPNLNRLSSMSTKSIATTDTSSSPSSSQPSTPRRLSTASTASSSSFGNNNVPQLQTVIALRVGPAPPDRPESASTDLYHTPNTNKLLPVWETIGGSALQSVLPPPYRASWAFDRAYWSADGYTLTPQGRAISSAQPGAPPATFCMQPFATNAMVCKDIGTPVIDRLWTGHNACLVAYAANEEDAQTEKERSVLGTAGDPGLLPEICAALLDRTSSSDCLVTMELTVAEVGMVPTTEADGSISWSRTSQITDLLDMESDKDVLLPIDLTAVTVDSYEAIHRVMTGAMARRHRAPDTSQPCGHVISRLQFTWTRNPEAKSSSSSISSTPSPLPMPSLPTADGASSSNHIGNMERRARFAMVDLRPRETAPTATMATQATGVSGSTDGLPVWQARLNRSADVIASVLAGNQSSIDHPLMTLLDDVLRTDGSYRVMLGAIGPYAAGRPGIAWDPVHTLNYLAAIKSGAAQTLPTDGSAAAKRAAAATGVSRTSIGPAPKRSSVIGRLSTGIGSSSSGSRTGGSGLAAPKLTSTSSSSSSSSSGISATGTRTRRVASTTSSVGAPSPATPQRIVTSSVKKT